MNFFDNLLIILLPISVFIFPGIALLNREDSWAIQIGRMLLWSISSCILLFWVAAFLDIYTPWLILILLTISVIFIYKKRYTFFTLENSWKILGFFTIFFILYLALTIPLLKYHQGLPTGDSQKAIFWAQIINATGKLPKYEISIAHLNRDPVDFYTPGLHAIVAFLTSFSTSITSVTLISFFGLAIAISTAFVAGILAYDISGRRSLSILFFTIPFVLTNARFMRYIREPGYHLQNSLGELLLFGLLWVAVTFQYRRRWEDIVLGGLIAGALVVSHQFSSFIAAFMLIPIFITFLFNTRAHFSYVWRYHRLPVIVALSGIIILLFGGASLGFASKIPHIFTTTPHLLFEVPSFNDYVRLFGFITLTGGVLGLLLIRKQRAFLYSSLILLILSQGPRLGIDIPPVRALLYAAIPLSIGSAFFFDALYKRFTGFKSIFVTLLLCLPLIFSANTLIGLSHTVRTNSTLEPRQFALNDLVSNHATTKSDAVLADDYDQRSLSWFLLSSQPVFSRIGADLAVQMDEAKQSTLRRELYLNQLDYEKIFSLANRPEIAPLLQKHSIRWVTGVVGSTENNFIHNPLAQAVFSDERGTLFEFISPNNNVSMYSTWLLRSSTLVNDIGDDQDTYEHLPVSLRATRLSDAVVENNRTWRTTTAPLIPLSFNIGDYVRVLWSQNGLSQPDQAVELLIQFKNTPQNLMIQTPTGQNFTVKNNDFVRLPASSVPWNENGFLTLYLLNPSQQPVSIDLVALGLARIP